MYLLVLNNAFKHYHLNQNMIKTDSELLSSVLEGNRKEICCVYGLPATGKTTLVKEAAILQSKEGGKVVYIDSEKSFNVDRALQINDDKKILDNIFILKPKDLKEQGKFLKSLLKFDDLSLVIVDTIGIFYRLELKKDVYGVNKEIDKQFNILSELCLKGVSVLITNQVYANFETNDIKLVGGNMFENWSKCLIKLEKNPRKLVLEKPENKEVLFEIGNKGLY